MLNKWLYLGLFLPLLVFGCSAGEPGNGGQALPVQTQETLRKPTYQGQVTILTYHHIVPREYSNPKNPAEVTVEDLRAQLDYLQQAGYTTVSLADYMIYLNGNGDLPPKPVLITFDDGYASNYYQAFPLLKERGMKATIFVVANWLPYEDSPYDPRKSNLVSWGQLKEMLQSEVFQVQSHTFDSHYNIGDGYALTHPKPKGNGELESQAEYRARVSKDLADSKKLIEKVTGYPVFAIAFPWGKYTDDTLLMVREAGYEMALTTNQGSNGPEAFALTLMRRGIVNQDGLEGFKQKLEGK